VSFYLSVIWSPLNPITIKIGLSYLVIHFSLGTSLRLLDGKKNNHLILYMERKTVYYEIRTKHINFSCRHIDKFLNVKIGSTHKKYQALKG